MPNRSYFSRRDFLKTSGVGVAALSGGVWSGVAGAASESPNEKLNIACVGTANRAAGNIAGVGGENLVAFCDIDKNYLDRAVGQRPGSRGYADYREMIDKEGDKIDAVVVSTADHHHAPATIRAIRAGKHVYCEKPLAHTVFEARHVAKAAKEAGVATQMGTQIHAGENYRRVVEIIQSGAIGDVTDVHVWVGKHWGATPDWTKGPADQQPPPNLSWDLWLGPASERPFLAGKFHPAQWRRWWDFGNGTLGDMGCHFMDLPFWALKLRHPTTCEAEQYQVFPDTCPQGMIVHYEFPAREAMPPVKFTWYDGQKTPRVVAGERVPGNGVMFVGSDGKLFADYNGYRFFPADKFSAYKLPEPTIPRSIGHHAEWIKACKEGTPTTCNFDYSGALSETVLLGSVALRTGKKLDWDGENLRATNCPEAEKYINKEYRSGWEVA